MGVQAAKMVIWAIESIDNENGWTVGEWLGFMGMQVIGKYQDMIANQGAATNNGVGLQDFLELGIIHLCEWGFN